MASAEFDESSAGKRPAVQVGDPFMEKLLLEACLEVMKTDACVGVQDMGAAGLTCATSETGSRGGTGIEIDVALVPQRETGMTPYEIMLSESQERMLLIVRRGREAEVERIFEKWDLHAVRIGEVTADGMLRVKARGVVVAEVPNRALTDEAPVYRRPFREPAGRGELHRIPVEALGPLPAPADAFMRLLGSPTVASKRWIFEQYDHMVRTNTILAAGAGAGVVRVKGTGRALAMSTDGNGRFCQLDPRLGAKLAVAEAARNVACAGGLPIGATNCLNFGNPERPEIMWQFAEAVAGIGEACRALGTPITGGNVSLYNETEGRAILPTPVIGVVGLIEDASRVCGRAFLEAGLDIVLLGANAGELGGSEYLETMHGLVRGVPPALDLDAERALQGLLVRLVGGGLVRSTHDCAEGGLAVTLAECCFETGGTGARISVPIASSDGGVDPILATLFGESASRVLVSVDAARLEDVLRAAREAGVPAAAVGTTGGDRVRIDVDGVAAIDVAVLEAEARWRSSLSHLVQGVGPAGAGAA
jgi:phosphoribosylformylglycinamidine synthase